jgi:hypothetical protein
VVEQFNMRLAWISILILLDDALEGEPPPVHCM